MLSSDYRQASPQLRYFLNFEINEVNSKGRSALHVALLQKRNIRAIKFLLMFGANIHQRDSDKNTPLLNALIAKNSFEVVEILLNHRASVNVQNKDQLTPLHCAIRDGNSQIVRLLLQRGANINVINKSKMNALFAAVSGNNSEIVELLCEYGAKVNASIKNFVTPLHYAITSEENAHKIVQVLLDRGAIIDARDKKSHTPLFLASRDSSYIKCLEVLVNNGADINKHSWEFITPLQMAAQCLNMPGIAFLLKKNAEMKRTSSIVRNRQSDILGTAFFRAIEQGNEECVEMMMKKGMQVKSEDIEKETALGVATYYGRIKLIELILEHGVDINEKDSRNWTPLLKSINAGQNEATDVLICFGAKVYFDENLAKMLSEMCSVTYAENKVKSANYFLKSLIKLKTLKLIDDHPFFHVTFGLKNYSECFENMCVEECTRMQEYICSDRTIKFVDILKNNLYEVAVYLSVEDLRKRLSEIDFSEKFPIYANMLEKKIKYGIIYSDLLSAASESLKIMFNKNKISNEELPYTFITKTLSCLNIQDLRHLNEAAVENEDEIVVVS